MEGVDLWVFIVTVCFHIPGIFCIGRFFYEIITNEHARKIDVVVHYPLVFSSIAYQLVSLWWLIFFFGVHYDKDEQEPTKCIVFPYFQIMFQIAIILAICVSIYIPFLVFRRAAEFGTIYYSDIFQAGTCTLVLSAIISVIYLQTSESSYIEDFCVPDDTTVYIIITCCILAVVSACAIYIWYAGLRAYLTIKWRSDIAFGDIMEVTHQVTPIPIWGSPRDAEEAKESDNETSNHEKSDGEDSHVFHLPIIQASEFELPGLGKEKSAAMPLPSPQITIQQSIMRLHDDVVSKDPRTRTGAKKVPDEQVLNLVNLVTNVRIKEDIAKKRKKAKQEAKKAIRRTPRKKLGVAKKRSPNLVARAHTYDVEGSPKNSTSDQIWKSVSADVDFEVNRLRSISTEEMKPLEIVFSAPEQKRLRPKLIVSCSQPFIKSAASDIATTVRLRSISAEQMEVGGAMIPLNRTTPILTPLSTISAITPAMPAAMFLHDDISELQPANSDYVRTVETDEEDVCTPMSFGNIEMGFVDLTSTEQATRTPKFKKQVTFSEVIAKSDTTRSDTSPDLQMRTMLSPSYKMREPSMDSTILPGVLTDSASMVSASSSIKVKRAVTFEEDLSLDASLGTFEVDDANDADESDSDSPPKNLLSNIPSETSKSRPLAQKPALVDAQTNYRHIDDILVGVVSTFNSRVLISLSFVFCTSVGSILVNIIHTTTKIDPALVHMFTIILFLPTVWISVYLFYQSSSIEDRNFLPFELPSCTLLMSSHSRTTLMTMTDEESGWDYVRENPEDLDDVLVGALASIDTPTPDDPSHSSKLPFVAASSSRKSPHAHVTLEDFKSDDSHRMVSLLDIDSGGLIDDSDEGGMVFMATADELLSDSNVLVQVREFEDDSFLWQENESFLAESS